MKYSKKIKIKKLNKKNNRSSKKLKGGSGFQKNNFANNINYYEREISKGKEIQKNLDHGSATLYALVEQLQGRRKRKLQEETRGNPRPDPNPGYKSKPRSWNGKDMMPRKEISQKNSLSNLKKWVEKTNFIFDHDVNPSPFHAEKGTNSLSAERVIPTTVADSKKQARESQALLPKGITTPSALRMAWIKAAQEAKCNRNRIINRPMQHNKKNNNDNDNLLEWVDTLGNFS